MNDVEEEDVVTKALRKARYNEIVHISIEPSGDEGKDQHIQNGNDNGSSCNHIETTKTSTSSTQQQQSLSLIPRLNEHQGGIQFMNLVDCYRNSLSATDDMDDEATVLLQKELQTKRWFFPMLNDTHRNTCYHHAIQRVIRHIMTNQNSINKTNSSTLNVLDIGSGSGLLSLMFAKEFANYCKANNNNNIINNNQNQNDPESSHQNMMMQPHTVHITSVEMSNAFGTLAQRTLEENSIIHSDPNIHITIHSGQHSTSSTFNSNNSHDKNLDDSSSIGNRDSSGSDPPHIQYDVCISELLEHGLFGEGWIPSIRDAWWRHLSLSPPAIVIPCGAKVYGVIVQSPWLHKYCRPLHEPYTFTTYDTCTGETGTQREHRHSLSIDLKRADRDIPQFLIDQCHVVLPVHGKKLIRDKKMTLVSNTKQIFNLNVSSPDAIPTLEGQTSIVTYTITHNENDTSIESCGNTSYGVLIWWDMILWEDRTKGDDIIYSLQPNEGQLFQDHWCQCLHILPSDDIDMNNNSVVDVTFRHDDSRIYVDNVKLHSSTSSSETTINETLAMEEVARVKRIRIETCNENRIDSIISLSSPAYISQERAFQLNDQNRTRIFHKALESAILHQQQCRTVARDESNMNNNITTAPSVTILDLSDFALGACIAATICHTMANGYDHQYKIVSVENSSGHLPILASQVLSNLMATDLHQSKQVDLSVLQCYNENITFDVVGTGTQAVDVVFSEPYYEILEGCHLQEALNFYYTVRLLRSNGIIDDGTVVLPGMCHVKGCIIESPDLRHAYGPCGDSKSSIFGIQHEYVNRIGQDGRGRDMSIEMWKYDYKVLSHTFELGSFQYMDPNTPVVPEATNVCSTFHTLGGCDALMVWLEYSYALPSQTGHDKNGHDTVISTNSQSYNQIIQILNRPNEVTDLNKNQVRCRATYGGNQFDSHHFDVLIQ